VHRIPAGVSDAFHSVRTDELLAFGCELRPKIRLLGFWYNGMRVRLEGVNPNSRSRLLTMVVWAVMIPSSGECARIRFAP
jgi:hypothetical protein